MTTHSESPADTAGGSRRLRLLIVVLVVGLLAGWGFGRLLDRHREAPTNSPPSGKEHANELPAGTVEVPEEAQRNAGVKTAAVENRTLPATLNVTGTIGPDEARVAHIRPLAQGVIRQVSVSLGTRVSAGQALVTLDNVELGNVVGEYRAELAALRQAQTNLEVRRTALRRAEELIKIEAIAQQTLDERRAEVRNAEASVASAEARAAKFEEQVRRFGAGDAQLTALRSGAALPNTPLSQAVLRAPFAGVVTQLDAAVGEQVDASRELFTIADISTVWVLADVYEQDLARITTKGDVAVKVDAYPNRTFTGRVAYVSDLIEPSTRTAKVRVVVTNREGALKLDMFARIAIPTTDERDTLVVPLDAVQRVDNQPVVFVRESPSRFKRRDVSVGASARDVVEVLSGLQKDDVIVTAGSFYLKTALLRERIGDEH